MLPINRPTTLAAHFPAVIENPPDASQAGSRFRNKPSSSRDLGVYSVAVLASGAGATALVSSSYGERPRAFGA